MTEADDNQATKTLHVHYVGKETDNVYAKPYEHAHRHDSVKEAIDHAKPNADHVIIVDAKYVDLATNFDAIKQELETIRKRNNQPAVAMVNVTKATAKLADALAAENSIDHHKEGLGGYSTMNGALRKAMENNKNTRLGSRHNVIYVDDQQAALDVMTMLLQRTGYDTEGFTQPEEALKYIKGLDAEAQKNTVLLTDHDMPAMTGEELLKAIKHEGITMPSVMLSGTRMESSADANLLKPARKDALVAAIKEVSIRHSEEVPTPETSGHTREHKFDSPTNEQDGPALGNQ